MVEQVVDFNRAMGRFQLELVRWNRQISLVSRQDTARQVAVLIGQCRSAAEDLLAADLASWSIGDPVAYFDLGSGGGLPGFVWHQMLAARFPGLETFLVEPREKRAWFLERLKQIEPCAPLKVVNGRWGDNPEAPIPKPPTNILISLKALRLPDSVILSGLGQLLESEGIVEGGRLVIARFYPAGQQWNAKLENELAPYSEPVAEGRILFLPCGCHVLAPGAGGANQAALVVSVYELARTAE